MPPRVHSYHADLKLPTPAEAKGLRAGVSPNAPEVRERTAAWPTPSPTWATSFNRKTKVPVVKTRAAKHGLD